MHAPTLGLAQRMLFGVGQESRFATDTFRGGRGILGRWRMLFEGNKIDASRQIFEHNTPFFKSIPTKE
jgi:hypothetical protein